MAEVVKSLEAVEPIQVLLRSDAASTNIHEYQRKRMLFAADVIDDQERRLRIWEE